MRAVGLALCICSLARADVSVPRPSAGRTAPLSQQTRCAARLEIARTEIAAIAPVFANAVIEESEAPGSLDGRIERVELRLDESLVAGARPFVFVAQVWSRRSLWADSTATTGDWSPVGGRSIYRQTPRFEGQIATHAVAPLFSPLTEQRIIELYLKPAVDDCLRRFD